MRNIWLLPAFLAVAFLLLTAWTMITTGQPAGFLLEHLHSRWGTQIGIDLFNALFVGVYFAHVLSRHYRFRAWPYVALTLCTGSPGLLALAARVLYARGEALPRAGHKAARSPRRKVWRRCSAAAPPLVYKIFVARNHSATSFGHSVVMGEDVGRRPKACPPSA